MQSRGPASSTKGRLVVGALRYLYFRIYDFLLKRFGVHDYPHVSALFATTFLISLNILSVPVGLAALGGPAVDLSTLRTLVPLVGASALTLNYLLLYRGRRYEQIAMELEDETENVRRRRTVAVWVYVIATVAAFYGILMFEAVARSHRQ